MWLQRPVLASDDAKPIELIARGEYQRVASLISEIEYPGVFLTVELEVPASIHH